MHVEDTTEIPRGALAEDELHGRGLNGSERRREGGRKKRKKE